jgi:hypothetical protein
LLQAISHPKSGSIVANRYPVEGKGAEKFELELGLGDAFGRIHRALKKDRVLSQRHIFIFKMHSEK